MHIRHTIVDICLIPLIFHMWIYDRMTNMFVKIGEAYPLLRIGSH